MNLLNDILVWTQTLPNWQRDAVRRLLQREDGLSEEDYAELYGLLKAEHKLDNPDQLTPEPLAASHLPATIQSGETVTLKEMYDLDNVNRIAPNQKLSFCETGMSVIYGGNGAGKSGYVRVMKQACRSRDQLETVHSNANDPAAYNLTPKAKFKVNRQGTDEKVSWERGAASPEVLSMISVFDSRCARSYLTAEQDVAYLPYGLDIVENLARGVIPELTKRLTAEINAIDTNTMAFNHLLGETEVGKVISKLNAKTNVKTLEALGTLSDEEIARIAELNKALAEVDPLAKAGELRRLVSRLKRLSDNISKVSAWVDDDAILRLKALDDGVVEAEDNETKAATALQSGETLLSGTGEKLWKVMFEAARKYSTEIAYPEHEFPYTDEGAQCPLCQSVLDEAGDRLIRFEQYIKDDVARIANEKRDGLASIRKKLESVNLDIPLDNDLCDEINLHDNVLVQSIIDYQKSIDARKDWMLNAFDSHNWKGVDNLAESPRLKVRGLAAQKLIEARTFIKASNPELKKTLAAEYEELIARQKLQTSLQAVLDLIERIKQVAGLDACKKDLKTTPISNKSKDFASHAVTKELKTALDKEFANLGVGHINTKLKEKNIKGRMHHQLLLELPASRALDEILSEGEQRAIALGSFLAELSLANHSCGIIFDDPVSSLDHWRRKHVAQRLAEEAKHRQVIIFTHDTSFLGQLRDEIDRHNLDHKIQFMEWEGQYSGNIYDGLPWGHASYRERIDALERMHKKLVDMPWPAYPNDEEAGQMYKAYDRLRSAIERVIQDVVFCGVVQRYRDWISIRNLENVVGFEDSECAEINRLYQRCNEVVDAHDPSSAKNAPVPGVTELGKDIDDLKAVIDRIKARRAAQNTATP